MHLTIALVLCAIPAMVFGQIVSCEACTHDVSIYMGDGGLIAEADGVDEVTWVATCGDVTHHGELEPDNDGVVMMQFTDSGLVCNAETSRFQIGPVEDGGWFWITRDTDSAVGPLVNQDVLDNARAGIANPGPGVTMKRGRGAVLLREKSTGRLSLLPDILPEPPMAALRTCGYDTGGPAAAPTYTRRLADCALGDGGTLVVATVTGYYTGKTVVIPDGGAVTRPAGIGEIPVEADLWMNGSGHFTTDAAGSATLGHPEFAAPATRHVGRLDGVTYTVKVGTGPAEETLADGGGTTGGVGYFSDGTGAIVIRIAAEGVYCGETAAFSLPVTVTAIMPDATDADQVTPAVKRSAAGVVGRMSFTVVCP